MARLQEGGWGWFVVLGRFVISFLHNGIHKSFGVLLPHLTLQLNASLSELGLCAGLYAGLTCLLGPVCIVLLRFVSPRKLVMLGSFLAGIAILSSAFADNFFWFLVAFTLAGIGQGLCAVPCIVPVTWYFNERFALANGVSVAGGSFGMIFLPPITQFLLNVYGLLGTLLIISALSFFGCVSGAFLRIPQQTSTIVVGRHYNSVPSSSSSSRNDNAVDTQPELSLRSYLSSFVKLFINYPKLTLFQVVFALYSVGYSSWMVYLVPHAIDKGIPADEAVFLSTIGGVGAIIGRVGHGPLVDHGIISDTRLFAGLSLLCATTFLFDPLIHSFGVLCAFALVAGVSIGARYPISVSISKSLVDNNAFVLAIGWTHFFTGVGKTIGGLLPGLLVDKTGNYRDAFLVTGGIDVFIVIVILCLEVHVAIKKKVKGI